MQGLPILQQLRPRQTKIACRAERRAPANSREIVEDLIEGLAEDPFVDVALCFPWFLSLE